MRNLTSDAPHPGARHCPGDTLPPPGQRATPGTWGSGSGGRSCPIRRADGEGLRPRAQYGRHRRAGASYKQSPPWPPATA